MTIDEAINRIETVKFFLKECSYENIKNTKFPEFMPLIKDEYEKNKYSLDSVITFLRAQAERANTQPLTLDELREMDGEPVWVVTLDGTAAPMWEIIVSAGEYGIDLICVLNGVETRDYADFDLYGDTWLAYRHKPMEAHL